MIGNMTEKEYAELVAEQERLKRLTEERNKIYNERTANGTKEYITPEAEKGGLPF